MPRSARRCLHMRLAHVRRGRNAARAREGAAALAGHVTQFGEARGARREARGARREARGAYCLSDAARVKARSRVLVRVAAHLVRAPRPAQGPRDTFRIRDAGAPSKIGERPTAAANGQRRLLGGGAQVQRARRIDQMEPTPAVRAASPDRRPARTSVSDRAGTALGPCHEDQACNGRKPALRRMAKRRGAAVLESS